MNTSILKLNDSQFHSFLSNLPVVLLFFFVVFRTLILSNRAFRLTVRYLDDIIHVNYPAGLNYHNHSLPAFYKIIL